MRSLLVGAFCLLVVTPSHAQAPEGTLTRIRGMVERVEGQTLTVKLASGQDVPVTMAGTSGSPVW